MKLRLFFYIVLGFAAICLGAAEGRILTLQADHAQQLQPAEPVVLNWPVSAAVSRVHVYYSGDEGKSWWLLEREMTNNGKLATYAPLQAGPVTYKVVNSDNGQLVMQSTASFVVRTSTLAAVQTVVKEAEDGLLDGPMKIEINGQAFNNRVVNGYNTNRRGSVELLIDVAQAGVYTVWARVLGPNDLSNSFFMSMDNNTERLWDLKKDNLWHWDQVSDRGATGTYEGNAEVQPVLFTLTAGKHVLRIRNREKLTLLDQVRVTNDLKAVPNDGPSQWIDVMTPRYAQIIPHGQPFDITWQAKNISSRVNIDLSLDQGVSYGYAIVKDTENDGSFIWNIPKGIKIGKALLRIQAVDNGGFPQDMSDGFFAIVDPALDSRQIIVQYPNGGEKFVAGQKIVTKWTMKNYWGKVNVYFSLNNGLTWQTAGYNRDATKDQFTYDWTVPNIPSTQALLKVADADAGFPSDISNAVFTITENAFSNEYLELVTPNGTEKWAANSVQHVVWFSYNMTHNINLDLTINNGVTWTRVLSNQPPNGWVDWTVPNTPSIYCKMRATDAVDGSPVSMSANAFSIVPAGTPPTDYAVLFDGIDDFIQVANNPSLNVSNKFTIEFWLKTDKPAQNWGRILEKGMWDEYSVSFYGTSAKIAGSLVVPIPGSTAKMAVTHGPAATALNYNKWYHVALTYDGAAAKLYVFGKQEYSKALTSVTPRSLTEALIIGAARSSGSTSYPFRGALDELRLWNLARTQQQIAASMNVRLLGNEAGLAAYYAFDEGAGQFIGDKTANSNHGFMGSQNTADGADPIWVASDRLIPFTAKESVAPLLKQDEEGTTAPAGFALYGNYPNPFNSQTTIRFSLAESRNVDLSIYDLNGRLIKTVASGAYGPGENTVVWDGMSTSGEAAPSGVYFYRLVAGDWSKAERMVMVK